MTYGDQKDRSFVARFGATIVRGGIASIPYALYRYQGELSLTSQQTWFVSAILARKWDSDMPMPSLKQMAEQSGVSRVSLHNYQRELVQAGWLKVINRQNAQGGKDTNIFDFEPLFRRLEELLIRDRGETNANPGKEINTPHVSTSLHTHVNPSEHPHVSTSVHVKESVSKEPLEESFNISNIRKSTHSKDDFVDNAISKPVSGEPQTADTGEGRPVVRYGVEGMASILSRRSERPRNDTVAPLSDEPTTVTETAIPAKRGRGRPRKFESKEAQAILFFVEDLRRQIPDSATLQQSVSRLLNLFHEWGKGDMDAFSSILYEARSITRYNSNHIRGSKFAYFCTVLEGLLGLKDEQASLSLSN